MRYHSYIFFDTYPSLAMLPKAELEKHVKEFIERAENASDVRMESYSTLALKADTRFMLHIYATAPDTIQLLIRDLLHTQLGAHLKVSYTLLGMTRSSQYNPKHAPAESAPDAPHRYLVIYPFTKTIGWHFLPYEERRTTMKEHVDVGRKYSEKISQLLLYSYGIDDHEFIVSYQMDDLEAFQSLVMEMRETQSRVHTKNDLPIFTCIHMPLSEALSMI